MRLRFGQLWILAVLALAESMAAAPAESSFELDKQPGGFLLLKDNGVPVLRYVSEEILPEGIPADRRRSTYVHPLYSIDGVSLTDDFPADHHQHRGMSWTWLKVSFDGITKDLWTLRGIRQKMTRGYSFDNRGDEAVLKVKNGWFEDSSGRQILDEEVTFRVHPKQQDGRMIDYELRLSARDSPVTIGVSGTGYSGFAARIAPREEARILTPAGTVQEAENKVPHPWADFSGRFGGSKEHDGIAIFQSKLNPYYPDGWTLRAYGFIGPCFTNKAPGYPIGKDKPLVLRYRVWVHKGKPDAEKLEQMHREYNQEK